MISLDQLQASDLPVSCGPALRLLEYGGDLGALRPWRETDTHGRPTGRDYITITTNRRNKDGTPVLLNQRITNTPTLLTRDEWLKMDAGVRLAQKTRLKLWSLIYGANPYNIDGMSTIAIGSWVGDYDADATISMDGLRRSERTKPVRDRNIIPVPIIHSDGRFPLREVLVSRKGGLPLDTTGIAAASRKNAEIVEQLCIGTTVFSYATGTIYGITNFPNRSTKVMMLPTDGAWTPVRLVTELLNMISTMVANKFYGPYALFYSNGWDPFLDADYNTASQTYTGDTLRTRVRKIAPIASMQQLDFLTDYQMILVQMDPETIEGVQGLPPTTVQWEEQGGMELAFKVFQIQFARLRADINGLTGIIHGTAFAGGTSTTTTTTTTT